MLLLLLIAAQCLCRQSLLFQGHSGHWAWSPALAGEEVLAPLWRIAAAAGQHQGGFATLVRARGPAVARPELRVTQLRRDRMVLTAQEGAATQDRQNSQKRGAAKK